MGKIKDWWNHYDEAAVQFTQEWYRQGGKPGDSPFDVAKDILKRVKALEEKLDGQ